MRAKAHKVDDIELIAILDRILESQLGIIESRLAEVQNSAPNGREAEVLFDLFALSKAAKGILRNAERDDFQKPTALAS